MTGSPEEPGAYIEWLRIRTKALLGQPLVWAGVEAAAAAAAAHLAERTLSGRRMRDIVQSAKGETLSAQLAKGGGVFAVTRGEPPESPMA